jgi:hypothetical protein
LEETIPIFEQDEYDRMKGRQEIRLGDPKTSDLAVCFGRTTFKAFFKVHGKIQQGSIKQAACAAKVYMLERM